MSEYHAKLAYLPLLSGLLSRSLKLVAEIYMHRLELAVCLETRLSQLSPNTALFDPAEWHTEIAIIATIHPDRPCFEMGGNAVRPLNILGKDSRT